MKKLLLYNILILSLSQFTFGQSLEDYQHSAIAAFENEDYPTAFVHARIVLEEDSTSADFIHMAAVSGLEVCALEPSQQYFTQLMTLDTNDQYWRKQLLMAQALHRQGKYLEAKESYSAFFNYLNTSNSDSVRALPPERKEAYENLAINMQEACDSLLQSGQISDEFQLAYNARRVDYLSTMESDYALPIFNNTRYFSTLTPPEKADRCNCDKPCQEKLSLYQYDPNGNKSPVLPEEYGNAGHVTFGDNGNRMYFTLCPCEENQYTCALYYRDKDESGTWGELVKLPEKINRPGYTATQPFIYTASEIDYLYYVSDYSGQGGLDIWYCTVQDGEFSDPVNFVEVNTAGDEVTPFYHDQSCRFFFSSKFNGMEGRFTSLGGYDFDVYSMKGSPGNFDASTIANVGRPINSLHDDLYFSINEMGGKAYFSSNRDGVYYDQRYPEFEHCCPDIFEADIQLTTDLLVKTICIGPSEVPVNDPNITLINTTDDISDYQAEKINGNTFLYKDIPLDKDFEVVATKDQYRQSTANITTANCSGEKITMELVFESYVNLEIFFRDSSNHCLPVQVEELVVRSSDGETVSPHKTTGDAFVFLLERNKLYTVLPYSVRILKKDYHFVSSTKDLDIVTRPGCSPETMAHTFYLDFSLDDPLPLYFDHAIPGPNFSLTEAAATYETYYNNYQDRKAAFYEFCDSDDSTKVKTFFHQVDTNMIRLKEFTDVLSRYLNAGSDVEITIRGFASPAGSGTYNNDALSQRRIDSMKKYFKNYCKSENIILDDNEFEQRVKIRPDPKGSKAAPRGIPKSWPCNEYSVAASKERRIEIVDIVPLTPDDSEQPCENPSITEF